MEWIDCSSNAILYKWWSAGSRMDGDLRLVPIHRSLPIRLSHTVSFAGYITKGVVTAHLTVAASHIHAGSPT